MKYISDLTDLADDEVVMFGSELIKAEKLKAALDSAFSSKVQDSIQTTLDSYKVQVNVERSGKKNGGNSFSYIYGKNSWFQDGVSCEVLKLGAPQWKKGKLQLKVSLEFLPDEPEEQEVGGALDPANESPLDEIRQLINGES